jgi:hypothetical protein
MDSINNRNSIFIYKSPVGNFFIQFDKRLNKWMLGMENEVYGHYIDPVAAADDVYCQASGCYEWDLLEIDSILEEIPTDIYCWDMITNR